MLKDFLYVFKLIKKIIISIKWTYSNWVVIFLNSGSQACIRTIHVNIIAF